jgi:hypothetical protein
MAFIDCISVPNRIFYLKNGYRVFFGKVKVVLFE